MKRVLDHIPPWVVVPVSVLGASLLLALVQWASGPGVSRFECTASRQTASSSTPPVAKHKPVAALGIPSPHLLPRMEGVPAESAKASDHLPNYAGVEPQCLASSDAVAVLAPAGRHGPRANTGWLPADLSGSVRTRPVPLLTIAAGVPQPQMAVPAPRYGMNTFERPQPLPAIPVVEDLEALQSPSLELVHTLFQSPVMERASFPSQTQSPPPSAGASPVPGFGAPWQAAQQIPVPLPPVWETLDAVYAILPDEPDLPGEVESPVLAVAANGLDARECTTDDGMTPVGPDFPDDVEPPMLVVAGNGLAPECSATGDELMPLPPVEPGLLGEIGPSVIDAGGNTGGCEQVATDGVWMPLPPVEPTPDDPGVDLAEAALMPLPPVEPRVHEPSESVAIAMIGNLFVPIAAEPERDSEIGLVQNVGRANVGEVAEAEEETVAAVDDDDEVPQPLPVVEKALSSADKNETEGEIFDPRGYERSWDLELIAQEADKHTRRAFELASKKAHFSARLEFTRALRVIAQGLDTQRKTHRHSQALAAGLRAMVEAEEFVAKDGHLEAELDLAVIVGAHRTPVLRESDLDELTPMAALQEYHTFAQEQLSTAMGKEMAGSMALYGLGKLHAAIGDQQRGDGITGARPKAMVLLQAALIASPANHMASNELGVLLAKNGRQSDARKAFEHSVATCPTAEGWRNLALTCEQLGEMDAAYRAARETLALRGRPSSAASSVTSSSHGAVHWVSPAELANRGGRLRTVSAAGASQAR